MFLSPQDAVLGRVNPTFQEWEQHDQLNVSWLLASMSNDILSRLVNRETLAQVWHTLEVFFAY